MAITQARKTRIKNRIAAKEKYVEQLYKLQENFDDVESYAFDSGEGKQQTKFRSLSEVTKEIMKIESQIDRLHRLLIQTAVINVNLRRN